MKRYKVISKPEVREDLRGIFAYISNDLKEHAAAQRICDLIETEISALNQFPMRVAVIEDEPFAAKGIRRLLIKNYTIFYIVDNPAEEVHVLRVVYNRREWNSLM